MPKNKKEMVEWQVQIHEQQCLQKENDVPSCEVGEYRQNYRQRFVGMKKNDLHYQLSGEGYGNLMCRHSIYYHNYDRKKRLTGVSVISFSQHKLSRNRLYREN